MTRLKKIPPSPGGTSGKRSTAQQNSPTARRYPAPSARKLAAALGVGDGSDTVHPVDLCGLMLAGLQGLGALAQEQQKAIRNLSAEVARCRRSLAGMKPGLRHFRPEGAT